MVINKEVFEEWINNPVTQAVFDEIVRARDSLRDALADGQTLSENCEETQYRTTKLIGQIEGLNQLLNIEYKEVESDE